jgi:hypothetical protein
VRNSFAQFFFNCVADCRTSGRADSTKQCRPNHSKRQQRSNAWHCETCDCQTSRRATRGAHCSADSGAHRATHAGFFSVGDRYTWFQAFRGTSWPYYSYPIVGYTKTF